MADNDSLKPPCGSGEPQSPTLATALSPSAGTQRVSTRSAGSISTRSAGPARPGGVPVRKNGPVALKHNCFRCKVNKWVVDFKEGRSADLTRVSVCLFCELKLKIETQAAKIITQERAMDELTKKFEQQELRHEEQLTALREKLVEQQTAVPRTIPQSSSPAPLVSRPDSQESALTELEKRVLSLEKDRQTVDSGRVTYRDVVLKAPQPKARETLSRDENSNVVGTKARPATRKRRKRKTAEKKEELQPAGARGTVYRSSRTPAGSSKDSVPSPVKGNLLLGDSLVGRQTGLRFKQLRQENQVLSFPGAKIGRIIQEIQKLRIDRNSTLVVSVGGNDLFHKNSTRTGSVEKILADYNRMLGAIKSKVNRAIVVGLLPRKYASREQYGRAQAINGRLSNLCRTYSLRYLDLWNLFFGRDDLFWKDGIHFSGRGGNLFAEQMAVKLFRPLKVNPNEEKVNKSRRRKGRQALRKASKPVQEVLSTDAPVSSAKSRRRRVLSTDASVSSSAQERATPRQEVLLADALVDSAAGTGDSQDTPAVVATVSGANAKRGRSQTVSPQDAASKRSRHDDPSVCVPEVVLIQLDDHTDDPVSSNEVATDTDPPPDPDPDYNPDQGNGQGTGGPCETSE